MMTGHFEYKASAPTDLLPCLGQGVNILNFCELRLTRAEIQFYIFTKEARSTNLSPS